MGKSWTLTGLQNSNPTALNIAIADLATSGNDIANIILPIDYDLLSMRMVSAGGPAGNRGHWGVVAYYSPVIPPTSNLSRGRSHKITNLIGG
jgi:hypothetical protein